MSNKEIAAILLAISLISKNVAKKIIQSEGSGQNGQSGNFESDCKESE